jgi:hypothetical protein
MVPFVSLSLKLITKLLAALDQRGNLLASSEDSSSVLAWTRCLKLCTGAVTDQWPHVLTTLHRGFCNTR